MLYAVLFDLLAVGLPISFVITHRRHGYMHGVMGPKRLRSHVHSWCHAHRFFTITQKSLNMMGGPFISFSLIKPDSIVGEILSICFFPQKYFFAAFNFITPDFLLNIFRRLDAVLGLDVYDNETVKLRANVDNASYFSHCWTMSLVCTMLPSAVDVG